MTPAVGRRVDDITAGKNSTGRSVRLPIVFVDSSKITMGDTSKARISARTRRKQYGTEFGMHEVVHLEVELLHGVGQVRL